MNSIALRAKLDRAWKESPHLFDPSRNALERERTERLWETLTSLPLKNQTTLDIGCGTGLLTRRLHQGGARVTAADASSLPLRPLKADGIPTVRCTLPDTGLSQTYDLILCADVLGELPPQHYRLAFAELASLLTPDGHLVCSTHLDLRTEGALDHFLSLARTEFDLLQVRLSCHRLFERLPFKQSRRLLLLLEKVSHTLWHEKAATHVIITAKRKTLHERSHP